MFELYFPEDKAEYLPSILILIAAILLSYFLVQVFKKVSSKQLNEAKQLEQELMKDENLKGEKDNLQGENDIKK